MKKHFKILLLLVTVLTGVNTYAQTDPLKGKRIAVIGDSYVRNHAEPVENLAL